MKQYKIDLEKLYREYLERVKLKEANMNPVQRVETKRAFYAGIACLLVELQDMPELNDAEYDYTMHTLSDDVKAFWNKQV